MIRPVATRLLPLVAMGAATALATVPAAAVAAAPTHPGGSQHVAGPTDGDHHDALRARTRSRDAQASRSRLARVDPDDSFLVQIDRVRPGTLPTKGKLRLSGTVTNISDETWTDLNVHPLSSYAPITSNDELSAAVEAAPELTFGGQRLQDPSLLDNATEELAPDETARWSMSVPVDKLRISGGDGVYVIGVQVLATDEDGGRDSIADGRARTFVPRVTNQDRRTRASLVVPVRQAVQHTESGRVAHQNAWARALDEGGRLDNLVNLLASGTDLPVSVALDPALLDVARHLGTGNPERNLDPTVEPDADEGDDGETPAGGGQTSEGTVSRAGIAAQSWRQRFVSSLAGHDVLALPYGDLDVAGSAQWAPDLLQRAQELSTALLEGEDVSSRPAVLPTSGLLPTETLRSLGHDVAVLLTRSAGGQAATGGARAVRVGDHVAVLRTDVTGAADPQDPDGATGIRQRVLAEAAVQALSGSEEPLVMDLPADFDPGADADSLLAGLDADFIRWQPLPSPSPGNVPEVEELSYPEEAGDREVPLGEFRAAADATKRARVLDDVLPLNDAIADEVQREALTELTPHSVDDTSGYGRLTSLRSWVDDQLAEISLSAPSFVILSSESGPFSLTVSNGLDQPVEFRLRARTAGRVEVKTPDTVALDPGASRTFNLEASSSSVGVHEVAVELVSSDGEVLSPGAEFNIRSNSVGKIIWVILASGLGILAIAVPLRIYRRVRKVRGA